MARRNKARNSGTEAVQLIQYLQYKNLSSQVSYTTETVPPDLAFNPIFVFRRATGFSSVRILSAHFSDTFGSVPAIVTRETLSVVSLLGLGYLYCNLTSTGVFGWPKRDGSTAASRHEDTLFESELCFHMTCCSAVP